MSMQTYLSIGAKPFKQAELMNWVYSSWVLNKARYNLSLAKNLDSRHLKALHQS